MNLIELFGGFEFKFSVGVFFFIIIACTLALNFTPEKRANKKLSKLQKMREFDEKDVLNQTSTNRNVQLFNNYIKPIVDEHRSLYERIIGLLGIKREEIAKMVIAGNVKDYNEEHFIILEIGGVLVGLFVAAVLFVVDGTDGMLMGLLISAIAIVFPNTYLKKCVETRKNKILDVFPNMLRMMVDATSIGHTVEDAIVRVRKKYPNELSDEFKRVEDEAKITGDWIGSLENMALRCDLFELSSFVSEVKTSKQRGTSISDMLLNFADKMDKEKTIRMTEAARKKSTTLLIPILIFLFVPLVVMIMLPALSQVMETL